ncbi:putative geranyltranstransferase [Leptotrichia wadei]|uniref:Putative geranyltranstransferase n=2 Tax=Leptotrichia wadei TaxID=157687 RepID=A0A133ZZZ7_9FUSO|nr:putative geranyltranstransferase [Leptotrichia wadei]
MTGDKMLREYLEEKKKIVKDSLIELLENYRGKYPEKLAEAMEYAVMNGGKRIRPILMYMICDLFEKNNCESYDKIKEIANALEFIHCYSLVHDDLPAMDNDDYRRGKLTVHKKYNEAIGVLVGDVLLTEAFGIIANSKSLGNKNKIEIISKLSEYAGFFGMVGGQFVDMESENKKVEIDTLKYIHAHKTGKLLTAAIELPMIALDIEGEKREKMVEYSKLLGIAFQIKDDILDIEGDFEEIGKKSNDVENEKTTYPSIFGLDESKRLLQEYLEKARKIIIDDFNGNQLFLKLTDYFGNRKK